MAFNNGNVEQKKNELKYKQGRNALLFLWILSAVNIVFVYVAESYFYFSSYFTLLLSILGLNFYLETGLASYLVIFGVLALITVAVYFVCWLLSKKHYAWMIVSLVLFIIDTLVLLIDFISIFATPELIPTYVVNLLFHAYVIYALIMAVIYGKKAKVDGLPTEEQILGQVNETEQEQAPVDPTLASITRTITVERVKAFAGAAVAISVYIDGKEVAKLKNGAKQEFTVDGASHEIACLLYTGAASNPVVVPEGEMNKSYSVKMKMGFTEAHIELTEVA